MANRIITEARTGSVAVLAIALVACVQPPAGEISHNGLGAGHDHSHASVKMNGVLQTVKPGASISFSHEPVVPLAVGQNGSVKIDVEENYRTGVVNLIASASEGLDIFGPMVRSQVDMTGEQPYELRIDYRASQAGEYYINIFATTDVPDMPAEIRTYAVPVQVGEVFERAKPGLVSHTLEDGTPAVLMAAEEVVR